jgi:hypothetical protein
MPSLASNQIYDEISDICDFMPENHRRLFCFRWGLRGYAPHTVKETAAQFQCKKSSIDGRLERCLWNLARHAQQHELPTLTSLLDDRERRASNAWALAGRWGNQESQFSEAVMLLAIAGIDVTEARGAARQHMIELGLARKNRWTQPASSAERIAVAREPVTQICDHILWPSRTTRREDLNDFHNLRPLPEFAQVKTGMFYSQDQGRMVEYSSDLERSLLRHLDADARIHSFQEQGLRIPYVIDGQAHDYYPDAIVRLQDGRVFVMEIKPTENLGEYDNWLKWASAARFCAAHGYGLYIGSPRRSILEQYRTEPDPEARDFITGLVDERAVVGQNYTALARLVGAEQLGLTATAELLDWRTAQCRLERGIGSDCDEAKRFWRLIARYA